MLRVRGRLALRCAKALIAALVPLLLACSAAAPASGAEAGVVLNNTSRPAIQDVAALGTHWVRVFATWPDLEPQRGVYASNWIESYDHLFNELPAKTKVIVDMVDTPEWETGSSNDHAPPANPEDYADFMATMARQWRGKVDAYEIWNEEDSPGWWVGAPDPVGYTQLLKATYPAIKAADPNATVLLGGLTGNDYSFLEGVYAAGGKGYFDAVAVHTDTACNIASPYAFLRDQDERLDPDSFLAYREIHATMLANGDDKPIWITEMSWRTTEATCSEGRWAGQKPEGVSLQQQATYLSQAYHCLSQDPYVQVALWFPLFDENGLTSGLVRSNNSRKPAFAAMREYARNGDQLGEPCGDFTGPQIHIAAPTDRFSYSGALRVTVSADSSQGVARITLEIDGKLIRNYTNKAAPSTLAGSLDWQGAKKISMGRHILTFLAVDKLHNISRESIIIYHRGAHKKSRRHRKHRHG